MDDLATLCTPQSQLFQLPPAPCSEDYDNANFLQKMVDKLNLTNANLAEMELQNLLEVWPPSPNRCDSPYLNDPMDDPW